ncbi:hypothetical protein WV31_04400 [Magnetospirillum sp. ME-1]|uniref:hypothetical protein n=1 Tax=Magnetospirillum sp. ME-1 TaxID=1639348 RepID=UPI000A17E98B|nr:hypothetical protein [Magnetospirillum sp. ME-1]ARJ64962.1 hypothetical protein WV31_04400 [Magnetospirillum sp. ME-1]
MTVRSRFWMLAAAAIAASGPALADQKVVRALGDDLPQPGAVFEDVRAMKLAPGRRIVCESDTDKPRLANPGLMKAQRSRGADHVRRCAVFADDGTGTWSIAGVPTALGEARLWLIFVEQGAQGRYRLAQFSLWGRNAEWDKAAGLLGAMLGEPSARGHQLLGWRDEQHETLMFVDEKYPDEFAVAVGDLRLRKLMRSPGTAIRE